jgi:hypothetical protein
MCDGAERLTFAGQRQRLTLTGNPHLHHGNNTPGKHQNCEQNAYQRPPDQRRRRRWGKV